MNAALQLSRRDFARLLGAGAGTALLAPQVVARGLEERTARGPAALKRLPRDPANLLLLNSNENSYGPSPAALEAMVEAHEVAMRYPDFWVDALQQKLAAAHEVDGEMVVVTCGSTELLKLAAAAFLGPGKRLVLAEPTFEAIIRYARLTGAEIIKVPVDKNYAHDLDVMAKAARGSRGLVYVCNPNNPTGTVVSKAALEKFLQQVPGESLVLIDEAYHHYVEDAGYGTMLDAVKAGRNVIIARTFSKIYGMAGLRIGYGVARRDLVDQMRPHRVPSGSNVMGCAAALVSFEDGEWVRLNRRHNQEAREMLYAAMRQRGREVIPSETNFVCVQVGSPIRPVIAAFLKQKIRVGRPFSGLPEHIRVSLGKPEEMEKFIAAFDGALEAASA